MQLQSHGMKTTTLILLSLVVTSVHSRGKQQSKTKRIIGGEKVREGEYPFVASVQHGGKHICTGSVISKDAILTAAHCYHTGVHTEISASDLLVGVGSVFWRYAQKYKIERTIAHPQYDHEVVIHDLALLKTLRPMELGGSTKILKLARTPVPDELHTIEAVALGWGFTMYAGRLQTMPAEQLNFLKMKSVPPRVCALQYEVFGEQQICMASTDGRGPCNGDVGGPLVTQESGEYTQIGIISYGADCNSSKPEVYTRISSYYDWIQIVLSRGLTGVSVPVIGNPKKKRKRT